MRHTKNYKLHAAAALAAGVLAQGCAEPAKDYNTVQPGYLPKAIFSEDWYYRQTIIESDPGSGLTGAFVGLEADVEKIKWEIREDQLIAYRTHEGVPGIDEDRTRPGSNYKGDIVATFSITSHFDIQREYNASTGEQRNVIGENSSDRPWYDRDFIRIETSTEVGGPADFGEYLTLLPSFYGVGTENHVGLNQEYMYSPDQPVIEPGYIEMTNRRTVGDDFTCGWIYGDWGCGSADVKIRHSFVRVNEEDNRQFDAREYPDLTPLKDEDGKQLKTMFIPFPVTRLFNGAGEGEACSNSTDCGFTLACVDGVCGSCDSSEQCAPQEACVRTFDDARDGRSGECTVAFAEAACTPKLFEELDKTFAPGYYTLSDCDAANFRNFERFGFFRTERPSYNRETGSGRDEGRQYLANIHQIWQQSYEWATEKNDAGDKVVVRDEQGRRQIKLDADGEPVAIPMADRKPKPIIYYLNIDFPADLTEANVLVMKDWDKAMMEAVAAATGRKEAELRDELEAWGKAQGTRDFFMDGDELQYRGMFQIRENNCSARGVAAYLEEHSEFYPHVEAALAADEHVPTSSILSGVDPDLEWSDTVAKELKGRLVPGNLHRVCATLRRATLDAGVTIEKDGQQVADAFWYQKVGDIRFNFLNWVNEQQPDGPLGYGPSGTDGESGRIVSANANIYGAALDGYARNAVDTVRAMNGDMALSELLEGKNIREWIDRMEDGTETRQSGLSDATKSKIDARRSSLLNHMGLRPDDVRRGHGFDPKKMSFEPKQVAGLAKPVKFDENVRSPGWERLSQAMEDPLFASMMVPGEFLELLAPVYNQGRPADEPTEDLIRAATEASTDPRKFAQRFEARSEFLGRHGIDMFEMVDDAVIGKALELKDEDPETLYKLLRDEIYRAVTLHEIGHTMGLTHNFEGSLDALNYQDKYWEERKETGPGDSDRNGIDDRAEKRVPEYTYSTIMDYHGRFNSDAQGLGKYDHAAMKAAYAGLLEVFDDSVPMPAIPDLGLYVAYVYGNDTLPSLLGDDLKNLKARKNVPVEAVVAERARGIMDNTDKVIESIDNPVRGLSVPRDVPYAYCEHAYVFRSRCKMFDQGSTNTEVVHHSIQRYWKYYFFNNFRRGRMENGFINGFFSRQSGLLDDLTYAIRYYIYGNQTSPIGRDYLEASLLALNFINKVMGTPSPGRHCLDADRGVFVPARGEACETYVDIAEGIGRDQFLKYDEQYLYNIDYIGTYFDKANFLIFLLDDSTNFFNVTDFGDSRRFSINYYRLFRPELIQMIRDMVFSYLGVGENRTFGAFVNAEGKVTEPVLVDPVTFGLEEPTPQGEGSPDTGPVYRVDAPVPPNLLWRAVGLSAVFNSSSFDGETDFRDYIMVYEEGSGEARELPEGTEVIKYFDPITHVTYVAPQTYDGASISAELLTHFNGKAQALAELEAQLEDAPEANLPSIQADIDQRRAELGHFSDLINQFRYFRMASEPYFD